MTPHGVLAGRGTERWRAHTLLHTAKGGGRTKKLAPEFRGITRIRCNPTPADRPRPFAATRPGPSLTPRGRGASIRGGFRAGTNYGFGLVQGQLALDPLTSGTSSAGPATKGPSVTRRRARPENLRGRHRENAQRFEKPGLDGPGRTVSFIKPPGQQQRGRSPCGGRGRLRRAGSRSRRANRAPTSESTTNPARRAEHPSDRMNSTRFGRLNRHSRHAGPR